MLRKTGVVIDERYQRHGAGLDHPESPARIEMLQAMLDGPDMAGNYVSLPARHATWDEIGLVHDRSHIEAIAATAGKSCTALDMDTHTTADSYDTALLAVGGSLVAVDAVLAGEVDNAFAFVRPPGHHASENRAAGFCLFNNAAVAARYALVKRGLQRALLVDWDLHHGDGTQRVFYRDPRVLYFSTHQFPAYPGSGNITEIGLGEGLGYTLNVPLKPGCGTGHIIRAFRRLLAPVAAHFRPEIILLSAGFDPYYRDPIGELRVTPDGFAAMTRVLLDIADASSRGRFVAILEGGYDPVGLPESVRAVLKEMRGETRTGDDDLDRYEYEARQSRDSTVRRLRELVAPIWRLDDEEVFF